MKRVSQPASEFAPLTNAEWHFFKDLIYKVTGIALSPAKKTLLVTRLGRRLKALRLPSFTEYYDKIRNKDLAGEELQALVNAITTNKTEFFRESHHFEMLAEWLRSPSSGVQQARLRGLRIWCAATSTGEEPYTIAAVVRAVVSQSEWERTTIFATDLDTNALKVAKAGHYHACDLENVPELWQGRLFTQVRKEGPDDYIVRSDLKARIKFGQLNLAKGGWRLPKPLDVVFCRNVLIYFDKLTQHEVVRRACRMLAPHGLLFLGHSEGLTALELRLESVGHTVYRASTNSDQSARRSIPQLHAVSLNCAPPPLPRPYIIGAEKNLRLFLRTGILVAMFSGLAGQSCVAVLKDDGLTPAGAARVDEVLKSMLRALRQLGGTVAEIQVKTVGVECGTGQCRQGDTSELQSVVHRWLEGESLILAAKRQVPPYTEIRIELGTGRLLLGVRVALSSGVSHSESVSSCSSPKIAGIA